MSNFHFTLRFLQPSNTNTTKNEEVRSENDQSSNAQQPSSPKLECISPRTVAAALAAASDIAAASASKSVLRKKDKKWVPDDHYSRLMDMNDIPRDPIELVLVVDVMLLCCHVLLANRLEALCLGRFICSEQLKVIMWINWACKQFRIEGLKSEKLFNMPGSSMFALTADDWRRLVPDANVNFLTHLELLKRCRGV
ncbi:unnamed protein product [Trichobilharzia regenti]|nr:unnamed protein product [Trichobilharzia regenti]